MNAAHLHLVAAHLPVVGTVAALAALLYGEWRRSAATIQLGWLFLLGCAASATVAYFSGPPAHELLEDRFPGAAPQALVEEHAVVGRGALVAQVVVALLAFRGLVTYAREEQPPALLRAAIVVAALGLVTAFGWTAHLGGRIRHEEIRPASAPKSAQSASDFVPQRLC
jgi:hypothetical protein